MMTKHLYPLIAILIALGAWFFPKSTSATTQEQTVIQSKRSATLLASGSNLKIFIKQGNQDYKGGVIDGVNQSSTIYISHKQSLTINATGSNIKIFIDEGMMEYVTVIQNGANIRILES